MAWLNEFWLCFPSMPVQLSALYNCSLAQMDSWPSYVFIIPQLSGSVQDLKLLLPEIPELMMTTRSKCLGSVCIMCSLLLCCMYTVVRTRNWPSLKGQIDRVQGNSSDSKSYALRYEHEITEVYRLQIPCLHKPQGRACMPEEKDVTFSRWPLKAVPHY